MLLFYEPGPTSDWGELTIVFIVLMLSLGIMVAFGAWWSR
jgi:hypothetical protein